MTTPEELFADIDLAAREYDNQDFGLPYATNEHGRGRDEIIQLLDAALNAARVETMRDLRRGIEQFQPAALIDPILDYIDAEIAAIERDKEK